MNKTGTIKELIKELKKEAEPFSAHLFNKDWENGQLSHLREHLPENTVLCILDFSENYKCAYQDEVQGAYWTQDSATVHLHVP